MKILALDIGTVRIGIATSDIMEIIASAYEVYRRKNLDIDVKYIAELVSKLDAGEIVIGLPLKLDGTEGQSVEMAREFGEKLSQLVNVPIVYQDERLSTVTAQKILIESGMRREKRKDKVDSIAATIILQTYLDKKSLKKGSLT
ncbi:MAG: Holliday junction resolvase RuvX [Clostridia bacterium]|nr:Holliday junction resolvase RuvX [Clostridia bacterium]